MESYYLVVSGSYVRGRLWKRDRGVCAQCGLDTDSITRRLIAMDREAKRAATLELAKLGFKLKPYRSALYSLWEADHVVPLAEGGSYSLDNIQTLCVPCHKEKTAEQAARKAKQRRLIGGKWLRDREQRLLAFGASVGSVDESGGSA